MKRTWFAIIFLLLAVGMCAGEQVYLHQFQNELNQKISAAQTALESGDTAQYERCATAIQKTWRAKNDWLYAVCEHAELNTLAVKIRSMPFDKGDEEKELHELKAMLYAFFENEKISFSNVL